MEKRRSIAVAQVYAHPCDVRTNVEHHVALARLAAEEEAQLLLFPELSLTGYEMTCAAALALEPDDSRIAPLREVAASTGMTLIAGAPIRAHGRVFLGACIIPPGGRVTTYAKQRLGAFSEAARCDGVVPPAEATVFAAGNADAGVPIGDGFASLAICADIGDAHHPARAAASGAVAYLASMFVIPSEYDADAVRLARYARTHQMVVAMANHGRATGGLAAAGRSAIWAPDGACLVALGPADAGVAVAHEGDGGWRTAVRRLQP